MVKENLGCENNGRHGCWSAHCTPDRSWKSGFSLNTSSSHSICSLTFSLHDLLGPFLGQMSFEQEAWLILAFAFVTSGTDTSVHEKTKFVFAAMVLALF